MSGFLQKVSGARCNSINQRGYRRILSHRTARAHRIGRIVAPRNIHFAQKRTQFLPSRREQRTAENEPRTWSFAQRASRQQACRRVDSSAAPERKKQSFRTIVGLMSEQHMGCVARGREVADRSKSRVSRSIKRISAARDLDAACPWRDVLRTLGAAQTAAGCEIAEAHETIAARIVAEVLA